MTPIEVIRKLIIDNPAAARLILAGVSVFAAAAIVLSFKIDTDTAVLLGSYILAFSFVVTILARVLDDTILTKIIGWAFSIILLLVLLIIIYGAVLPKYNPFAPPVCILRFWQPCILAEDQATDRNASAVVVKPVPQSLVAESPATAAATVDRGAFTVYVQFAGFRREDVATATVALKGLGWNVPAAPKGGQRTALAAGLKEIRYRSPAEKAAAEQLAAEINAMGIVKGITPVQQGDIDANTLEVWIGL